MRIRLGLVRHGPWLKAALALAAIVLSAPPAAATLPAPVPLEFQEVAPQGFGDRQNSGAWSSQWWRGHLYVGTVRSWFCMSQAWFHNQLSFVAYPPVDPDYDCPPDYTDLPLRAEIWRFSPATSTWKRVYQAPQDTPIPTVPNKLTSRDMGYRGMAVFTEPDQTEALYVGSVTSNLLWPPMPPPRILRSTDGVNFEPIPQDPGTLLGDLGLNQVSFRSMLSYKGRLYVLNGQIRGQGGVLEAEDPAGGNDNFRWITPDAMQVYEMATFNGYLYLGLTDSVNGYSVVKTDATGAPPYQFTTVVPPGAFAGLRPSQAAVSMHVFNKRLYVGTANPVELIRINPDDSWDLIMGRPRDTPSGYKFPLTGLGNGFNWSPNRHLWRMQKHKGALYLGTYDESRQYGREIPFTGRFTSFNYGFDLYQTSDGYYIQPLTTTGFGDEFQSGVRTFSSTPEGLFMGTVSLWQGARIFRGRPAAPAVPPPARLEVETEPTQVLLSWDPTPGAPGTRYRVFRSDITADLDEQVIPTEAGSDLANVFMAWIGVSRPFREIGTTTRFFFVDNSVKLQRRYQYYVVADDATLGRSSPSNLGEGSLVLPKVTYRTLKETLVEWAGVSSPLVAQLREAIQPAKNRAYDDAIHALTALSQSVVDHPHLLSPWRADDVQVLIAKLIRRVQLAQGGQISATSVLK